MDQVEKVGFFFMDYNYFFLYQQKNKYIKCSKIAEEFDMLNECMKLNKEANDLKAKNLAKYFI